MKDYLYNLATDKEKGLLSAFCKILLYLLSLVYGLGVVFLGLLYTRFFQKKLGVKVISVGNITLGGTGKTSLVEYIALFLKQKGKKIAVLSRGYKRKTSDLKAGFLDSETMGDEPFMLKKNLGKVPVIVDKDRARGAKRAATEYAADTVILDDGFQQWKVKKDLEIVAIDAGNPFGNMHLLPRGILREPLRALKRADIFVLTKVNLFDNAAKAREILNKLNPHAEIFEAAHLAYEFYDIKDENKLFQPFALENQSAVLFCGIGSPDSFEKLALSLKINVGLFFKFNDHHNYSFADLEKVAKGSKDAGIKTVITTEKDAARISAKLIALEPIQVLVLRIKIAIKDEQRFHSRLLKLYSF